MMKLTDIRVNRMGCFCTMLMMCMSGCAELLRRDDYTHYRKPPQQLNEIEEISLKDLSKSPPKSLQEGDAGFGKQAKKSTTPAESIELDIFQVRAASLANNLDLKVELVNPTIANQAIDEQEAVFEPLFTSAIRRDRLDRPSRTTAGLGTNTRSTSFENGVRIPLRTGGTTIVNLLLNKTDDDTYIPTTANRKLGIINPLYDSGLQFSISQPLLRNAGIRTNTHFIRIAKYQRDIADAKTRLAAITILAETDRAYWRLYAIRGELNVRQEQYDRALQQLELARLRVAAGAAAQIEIMRAEAGVANRLEAIIITDTELRRRERNLKRIMNRDDLDLQSTTSIITKTKPNPMGVELDSEELQERAITNRMELLEIELQLAIEASQVDFDRNGLLPLVTLDFGYTINGLGASFHDAFRGATNSSYADYSVGVTAEIPIGNQAAKSRYRRARLQRIQRLATRKQRRLTIRQEVLDTIDQLEQAWQRILAARQEVVLAGRTYEAEKRQFDVGSRTSVEVLEAADFLAEAQSREVRSLVAYEIAMIDIAQATGTLLGQGRVIWESNPGD